MASTFSYLGYNYDIDFSVLPMLLLPKSLRRHTCTVTCRTIFCSFIFPQTPVNNILQYSIKSIFPQTPVNSILWYSIKSLFLIYRGPVSLVISFQYFFLHLSHYKHLIHCRPTVLPVPGLRPNWLSCSFIIGCKSCCHKLRLCCPEL